MKITDVDEKRLVAFQCSQFVNGDCLERPCGNGVGHELCDLAPNVTIYYCRRWVQACRAAAEAERARLWEDNRVMVGVVRAWRYWAYRLAAELERTGAGKSSEGMAREQADAFAAAVRRIAEVPVSALDFSRALSDESGPKGGDEDAQGLLSGPGCREDSP